MAEKTAKQAVNDHAPGATERLAEHHEAHHAEKRESRRLKHENVALDGAITQMKVAPVPTHSQHHIDVSHLHPVHADVTKALHGIFKHPQKHGV